MKKMSFRLLVALLSALMLVFISSCEEEEPEPEPTTAEKPVLGEDFEFAVDGNDVTFTTTLTGSVWFTNIDNSTDHTVENGEVVVTIAQEGTYPFTCTVLIDGSEVTSDTFDVVIEASVDYFDKGVWKDLTGGVGQTKNWRMDINSEGECLYFDGPVYYSGTDNDPYWSWDVLPEDLPVTVGGEELTTFFNWSPDYKGNTWLMAAQDYGTISFNAAEGTVSTNRFGETCSSTFSFDTTTMKLTVQECILPIDTGRLNEGPEGQFPDLSNLRIYSISDSAMQIGVKRVYEGFNDDGSQKESKWVMIYNFIVDDYTYPQPEEFTYSEPINTSFTQADLVGTWEYADVAQDWIGWPATGDQGSTKKSKRLNAWSTYDEMVTTLESWGASSADSTFQANFTNEYVFNDDGTCTLNGVENTYSVENGVISFSDSLKSGEFSLVWIGLSGKDVSVLDVTNDSEGNPYSYDGIWIGQKNGDKNESSAVHLVKKQ